MAKRVKVDFRELSAFIALFTPYRAGYAYKYKGKYWTTSRGFLTDELIQVAIDGEAVIGFKAMYRSAVLGLDVDDHEHGGWTKGHGSGRLVGEMTPELRDRVQRVKDAMGLEPSMKVRSSRGMHLFWFWVGPEFLSEATAIAKERLKDAGDEDLLKHVDILPQTNRVLRIPRRTWIVKPGTEDVRLYDRRRDRDAHLRIEDFPIYDFEEFEEAIPVSSVSTAVVGVGAVPGVGSGSEEIDPFGSIEIKASESEVSEEQPSSAPAGLPSSTPPTPSRRAPSNREEAEREVMPFRNGETNWQLGLMVIAGKREGMSDDEIEHWVTDWIGRSRGLGYIGDLGRNARNLRLRIESYGKKVHLRPISYIETWERIKDRVEVDETVVDEIMRMIEAIGEMRARQRSYVRSFVRQLLGWKDGLDRIVPGDADLAERVRGLVGFRQLRRRGYYPLPTGLMKRWYDGYDQVVGWLADTGVLVRQTSYHPEKGLPRWYEIRPPRH